MEMADTIVINKADGDNIRKAQLAKSEFNRRYIYFQQKSGWIPTTATCSAITQDGFKFGKPSRNLSNSRKAMIILMKNAWNRTNIGCSRLSTNN
jgi:LAO/AO transport system kinase